MEFLITNFWYFLAGFLGFFIWRRKKKKSPVVSRNVLIIGHRGASGYALQNSLSSIRKAVELTTDFIEVDVRRSSDGVFFLAHDDRVLGRRNRKFKISQQPSFFLKKLALPGGNKLVTLLEFVEAVPKTQNTYLDLKVSGCEFDFLSFLKKYDLIGRTIITSNYAHGLRLLKVLEPSLVVGFSFPGERFNTIGKIFLSPIWLPLLIIIKHTYPFYVGLLCSWAKADFVCVYFRLLTERLVRAAHKRGLLVYPFSVNRNKDIRRMLRWGVDGIVSDYPDRVKFIINNL